MAASAKPSRTQFQGAGLCPCTSPLHCFAEARTGPNIERVAVAVTIQHRLLTAVMCPAQSCTCRCTGASSCHTLPTRKSTRLVLCWFAHSASPAALIQLDQVLQHHLLPWQNLPLSPSNFQPGQAVFHTEIQPATSCILYNWQLPSCVLAPPRPPPCRSKATPRCTVAHASPFTFLHTGSPLSALPPPPHFLQMLLLKQQQQTSVVP